MSQVEAILKVVIMLLWYGVGITSATGKMNKLTWECLWTIKLKHPPLRHQFSPAR